MKVRIEVDCDTWGHVQWNLRRENSSKSRDFGVLLINRGAGKVRHQLLSRL